MKPLDRQMLDVVDKTRGKIFIWCGQFTPEFVATCHPRSCSCEATNQLPHPGCSGAGKTTFAKEFLPKEVK